VSRYLLFDAATRNAVMLVVERAGHRRQCTVPRDKISHIQGLALSGRKSFFVCAPIAGRMSE
jgi:hypothetical protein